MLLPRNFRFSDTRVVFTAQDVAIVERNGAEWPIVVESYKRMIRFFTDPILEKPFDLARFFPVQALYDGNSGIYYKLIGNHFPYMEMLFEDEQICSPPWVDIPQCLQYPMASQLPTAVLI